MALIRRVAGGRRRRSFYGRGRLRETVLIYLKTVQPQSRSLLPQRRDQIYPPPEGRYSEEIQQLLGDVGTLWDRLISMIEEFPDPRYTDYVTVSD